MTSNDDLDLQQLAGDWQAAPYDAASAKQIRHYVARRTGLLRVFAVADFAIGGLALPVLGYLAWTTTNDVERMAMIGLASITVATIAFGWWNRRGVMRASAATVAEFVAISEERLRRMRAAWAIGWVVLAAEVVFFVVWIWNRLYAGPVPAPDSAVRFAWTWLGGFTLLAAVGLGWFGRWLRRDAARFEALRRELE